MRRTLTLVTKPEASLPTQNTRHNTHVRAELHPVIQDDPRESKYEIMGISLNIALYHKACNVRLPRGLLSACLPLIHLQEINKYRKCTYVQLGGGKKNKYFPSDDVCTTRLNRYCLILKKLYTLHCYISWSSYFPFIDFLSNHLTHVLRANVYIMRR